MKTSLTGQGNGDRAIIIFNEKNQVIFANQLCEAIFKCPIDSLHNKPIDLLFDKISQDNALKSVRKGSKQRAEMGFRLNGHPAKGILTSMRGPGGELWLLLDLTFNRQIKSRVHLKKAAAEKLASREKALRNYLDDLLDASFDGMVISDAEANVLKANKAYELLSGIGRYEIVGRNLKDLIHDGTLSKAAVFEVTKTRMPTTMVHSYSRTGKSAMVTGSPVFDKDGKLLYVMANFRDITQLTEMSRKLGDSNILEFENETVYLNPELANQPDYGILVRNKGMKTCLQQATQVAQFDTHVLLLGESGTGKTRLAEIIHKASPRSNRPLVAINCGSIPETLLESELFGYEKGAFTGASAQGKVGQFQLASGGTLVLDEIGDLSLSLQVKLLNAIEEKKILKVGGTRPLDIDIRIIAITNKNLKTMVDQGTFREDLYFRLSVVPIVVPPLRDRTDEIPLLIKYFLDQFNSRYGTHKYLVHDLQKALTRQEYPGNVRELRNLVERLVVMSSEDEITMDYLKSFSPESENRFDRTYYEGNTTLQEYLADCEKRAILKVLKDESTLVEAAKRLDLSSPTLWRKLKKYGIRQRKMVEETFFQTG
jgi:PAS domain S-box-containing protein